MRTLTVVSRKGGAGKITVAVNLGFSARASHPHPAGARRDHPASAA